MMTSLFSIFDPMTNSIWMNWVSMFLFFILGWSTVWCVSGVKVMQWSGYSILTLEMKPLLYSSSMLLGLIIPLFIAIMSFNVMGLVPYIFTPTSHLVVTIALALPLWGCGVFFNWLNQLEGSLAHLVPLGTPFALIPFMVVIESLSGLMRPLTLSLRLGANMLAGHLLLSLVGNGGLFISPLVSVQFLSQTLLFLLEIAVAMIQAYVFSVLMSLYFSEFYSLSSYPSCISYGIS